MHFLAGQASTPTSTPSPSCTATAVPAHAPANPADTRDFGLSSDGFELVGNCLASGEIERLRCAIDALHGGQDGAGPIRTRSGAMYAARNLFEHNPSLRDFAASPAVRRLVEPVLRSGAFVVRSLLFDKTPDANWSVAWHQDTSIAVRERNETPGFGPWSVKDGVVHVRPPAAVLERMLTVRVHLDDADGHNGALLVLPGSHRCGILPPEDIEAWRSRVRPHVCALSAGGVLLMRPLLLHASRRAANPRRRRVLHLEFAADPLPAPLRWAAAQVAESE